MLKNYLLIAWRSATRDKTYSLLNVAGLTIGLTCAMVIFLYVYDEFTYDGHHVNTQNVYRLNAAYHLPKNGGFEEYALSGPPVAVALVNDFPEVEQAVRIRILSDVVVEKGASEVRFYENFSAADSNIFEVFTFPFVAGKQEGALTDARTVVISERMAMKYFNSTDVVGESLHLPQDSADLKITGVFQDFPANTHLKFDFIISVETHRAISNVYMQSWWSYSFYTYLKLQPMTGIKAFEEKIRFISRKYIPGEEDGSGYRQEYSLIPFSKIHLHSNLRGEVEPNSKASYVYIFLIIGVFILVIACINFMNLATARSAKRGKEIGLRKVAGALRSQLIGQFLGESFLMTAIAVAFAIGLTLLLVPYLNDFTGKRLAVLNSIPFWLILGGASLFVGLLAGSYPSFFLSAFQPVETLKGNFKSSEKGNGLRKTLVVFQFTISIFLMAGTLIIYKHLDYLRSVNLGFEKEQVVFIPTHGAPNTGRDFKIVKEEIMRVAGVQAATLSSRVPGKEMSNNVVLIGWGDDATWSDMRYITVDEDFIDAYQVELAEGRSFSRDFPSDEAQAFMLNESGVRRLGFGSAKEAIGQKLRWQNRKAEVIGVVKDFHFMSANTAIEPFLIVMNTRSGVQYLSAKLEAGNPKEALAGIEAVFRTVLPDKIFEYEFLDENFDRQYKAEEKFMTIFTFFALVAIAIAALGLYGLAMFMTELRVKEMGIRKVLGASEGNLVLMLTKDFLKLVMISFLIAIPAAWLAMNEWLKGFPMKEEIDTGLLVLAGGAALLIALLTVSTQSLKAARTNPVKSLSGNG